ncbi:hypothetical protein ACUSIJ_00295 [Pseudochelatococcus sp. B33]
MTNDPFRRDPFGFARVRIVRLPKWQVVLISALAVTLVLTLVVVAAGAFLLLFPVVLIAGLVLGLVARWRNRRGAPVAGNPARRRSDGDDIVDAEYIVITDRRREEER